VYVGGVYQEKATYSVSGTTLTFSEAPANNVSIEVMSIAVGQINSAIQLSDADGDTKVQVEESSDEDKIRFDTGGTERMQIDSNGNVGLFGDDVTQTIDNYSNYTTLTLSNNTGGIIQFEDDGNSIGEIFNGTDNLSIGTTESGASLRFRTDSGTERMRIDSSGNVGIGKTAATSTLEVAKSDRDNGVTLTLTNTYSGSDWGTGDNIGTIDFRTDDSSTSQPIRGRIQLTTGTLSGGNWASPNQMAFSVADGNTLAEAMRIDNSGVVNIGTASGTQPSYFNSYLNVQNNASTSSSSSITITAGNAGYAGLHFGDSDNGRIGQVSYNNSDDSLLFTANNSERMRIDSGGNLLVGQTSLNYNAAGSSMGSGGLFRACVEGGMVAALNRRASDGVILNFYKDGSTVGSISTNANSLPSDRNFKRDISDLDLGLNLVTKLKPSQFRYKISDEDSPIMYGLIAQDLEESLTEVGIEKNSTWLLQHEPKNDEKQSDYSLDYLKLTPVLIKAIQEQQTLIETQQTTINDLKSRIETLEG
jgi:hypothetical protein